MKKVEIEISKNLQVKCSEGYQLDEEESDIDNGVFVIKEKSEYPEKYDDLTKEQMAGWFVSSSGSVNYFQNDPFTKAHFPTKELAEASLALSQLLQLRAAYIGDWVPDWSQESNDLKYCIECGDRYELCCEDWKQYYKFMSFETAEQRDHFFKHHRKLLEIAKPLL